MGIWEMDPEENDFECIAVLSGHSQDVKMVKFHPTKELLASCSYDDTIKLWEEDDYDWTCKQTLEGHTSTVWSIAFSNDGNKIFSCSADKSIIVWQLDDSTGEYKRACTLTGHHNRVIYSIDVDESDKIITGSGDDSIKIFEQDITSTEISYQVLQEKSNAHDNDVNCVAWNPKNPNIFASCGDDQIVKLWKLIN